MPMPHARSESLSLPAILLLLATIAKRGEGGEASQHADDDREGGNGNGSRSSVDQYGDGELMEVCGAVGPAGSNGKGGSAQANQQFDWDAQEEGGGNGSGGNNVQQDRDVEAMEFPPTSGFAGGDNGQGGSTQANWYSYWDA